MLRFANWKVTSKVADERLLVPRSPPFSLVELEAGGMVESSSSNADILSKLTCSLVPDDNTTLNDKFYTHGINLLQQRLIFSYNLPIRYFYHARKS